MDDDIVRWILEYLLRKTIDDLFINIVISILPISNTDTRLKKTLLLRRIESEVSNATVTENILDFLEVIEEMDNRGGNSSSSSEAMRAAYCAVAVDCTVRFLEEEVERNGKYFETVKRIWRGRVGKMEKKKGESGGDGLTSAELIRWKDEIEDAAWDSSVCKRILMRNTRNEALKAVRVYLAQAWEEMGPPFLELAAQKLRDMEGLKMGENGDAVQQGETGSIERPGDRTNSCLDLIVHPNAPIQDGSSGGTETEKGKSKLGAKSGAPLGRRQKAVARRSRRVKITDAVEMDEDIHMDKEDYRLPDIPEAQCVQETLQGSPSDLNKVVDDLLPNTVRMTRQASARLKRDTYTNGAAVKENPSIKESHVHESPFDNAVQVTDEMGNCSYDVEGREGNPGGQGGSYQNVRRGRNLKERNLGSDVHEWDGSLGNFPGPSSDSPNLLSPKSGNVSPLGGSATAEKLAKRRKRKMWSPLEEDTLREGVKKFGVGNWKIIYKEYRDIFLDRNEVDLKDKWRNLIR